MGRLQLRVCEGRRISDPTKSCKPDPYCRIKCDGREYKTRSKSSREPIWDQLFVFGTENAKIMEVQVEVWDSNTFTDVMLGKMEVPISDLRRGIVMDAWFPLSSCATSSEIRLRILAVDFGLSPQPGEFPSRSLDLDPSIKAGNKFNVGGGGNYNNNNNVTCGGHAYGGMNNTTTTSTSYTAGSAQPTVTYAYPQQPAPQYQPAQQYQPVQQYQPGQQGMAYGGFPVAQPYAYNPGNVPSQSPYPGVPQPQQQPTTTAPSLSSPQPPVQYASGIPLQF